MEYMFNGKRIFPIVDVATDIIPSLSGIGMKDFHLDKKKCAYAWKTGLEKFKEYFGDLFSRPDDDTTSAFDLFPMPKPSPAYISYGHLISIGAPVKFPDSGEPNVSPFAGSIDEAIDILKERRGKDFSKNEMFQHYLDVWDYLKMSFPGEKLPFAGFRDEGPITTAVLMRGHDFFTDLYDEGEKCLLFLKLLSDSLIDYAKLIRRINGQPEIQENGYIADDFASLVSPAMWGEFVVPFWNQIYEGVCAAGCGVAEKRFVHVENLKSPHLKFLKDVKITHYQASVSPEITLDDLKENLDPGIAFDWYLYPFIITGMTDKQIEDWVDAAVRAGVLNIRTGLSASTHQKNKLDRIVMFFRAFDKYIVDNSALRLQN